VKVGHERGAVLMGKIIYSTPVDYGCSEKMGQLCKL